MSSHTLLVVKDQAAVERAVKGLGIPRDNALVTVTPVDTGLTGSRFKLVFVLVTRDEFSEGSAERASRYDQCMEYMKTKCMPGGEFRHIETGVY